MKATQAAGQEILGMVTSLGRSPRPPECVKLAGASKLWRIRVGDYRVVHAMDDASKIVDVRIVAHRREVYRDT